MHRLAPEVKVAATFLFVVAVVVTPREAFVAFAVDGAIVLTVARVARLRLSALLPRLVIELPFLAFAVFLPVVGGGDRVDVGPISVSIEGSWAAWNIVAKASIGVLAAAVLSATTEVPELLTGLRRLRVPRSIVAIAGFMTRYLDVLIAQLHRMQVARVSRGHDPRWIWQARAVASTAGALFLRSYERGERVYVAMLARGYDGTMPAVDAGGSAPLDRWALGLAPCMAAGAVAAFAAFGSVP